MTKFTDLTHEQRMLVHQATTEVYSRITCISTGAMAPLDAMADFFMTAYQLGQQAPRPSDMVVAHHTCRYCGGLHDPRVACPEYVAQRAPGLSDKPIRSLEQLLESRALDTTQPLVIDEPRINDVPLAPGACRHLNVNAQRVCVDCGAHLAGISRIDDERDDPHEDLGYKGRK